ncbi:hypothetical protein UFOVP447_91 [uncultured Caudovirales phage]|uniref:Uncharacterized protein n=1 Tax=uncultured Caudovirales phage TaxID=2100421 RepID=A0A6J5MDP7_9CAUD|nr:hypothetical protein UFOVP447_91 [uncultured Caudovirales phage]
MSIRGFFNNLSREIFSGVEAKLWDKIDPAESIASPKASNDFQPGNVNVLNISIVSADGNRAHNIIPYVTEVHIYENMVHPTMFCELTILDAAGMYERFPITTNEFVTISIQTPGNENPSEYRFAINRVGEKETLPNNRGVKYTLQLVSPELKRTSATPITKTFRGTISELIEEILKEDIGTEKRVNVESSTGIIDKTIGPRLPFAMIHEHYLDADNRRDNNGVYVFFENKHGYNLVTYEKLLKDGRRKLDRDSSTKRFVFTPDRNADAGAIKFRNILAYNQSMFCDAISFVGAGGLNSTAVPYDFATGAGERAQYRETEDGESIPTSDTDGTRLVGTDFIRQYERNSLINMLIAVNNEVRPNNKIAEVLVKRNAFLRRLEQIEAQIFIYGDTDLAVGDVIECSFPSAADAGDDSGRSRLDSGNYLITHLRHMILNTDRPQHVIACNLMKAGMQGN